MNAIITVKNPWSSWCSFFFFHEDGCLAIQVGSIVLEIFLV